MKKIKPEVWGCDKNGNFTIDGKIPTEEQHRKIANSLKIKKIPDNYIDLIPFFEAGLKRRKDLPDSQFVRDIRAIHQRLRPKEILCAVGSLDPPFYKGQLGRSRMDYFLRLIFLQSVWDGTSPQQVIDKALARKAKRALVKPAEAEKNITLSVDIPKQIATLNGVEYDLKSEQQARWLKVYCDHPGDWISGPQLLDYDSELDGTRTYKVRRGLPEKIDRLIETSRRKGCRLKLA